jgi:hypothetical protein
MDDEEQELLDENHARAGRQDLVYDSVFDDSNLLASIPFANRPRLTIVILLDYGSSRIDLLGENRIYANFQEALLQAYHVLKLQCETIAVVAVSLFHLNFAEPKEEREYGVDVTSHMELADNEFIQVCLLPDR